MPGGVSVYSGEVDNLEGGRRYVLGRGSIVESIRRCMNVRLARPIRADRVSRRWRRSRSLRLVRLRRFVDDVDGSVKTEEFWLFWSIRNNVIVVWEIYSQIALQPRSPILRSQCSLVSGAAALRPRGRHGETGRTGGGPVVNFQSREARRDVTVADFEKGLHSVGGLQQPSIRLCYCDFCRRSRSLSRRVAAERDGWPLLGIGARRNQHLGNLWRRVLCYLFIGKSDDALVFCRTSRGRLVEDLCRVFALGRG